MGEIAARVACVCYVMRRRRCYNWFVVGAGDVAVMWLAQQGNVWLRRMLHVGEEGLHVKGRVLDVALLHLRIYLMLRVGNLFGSHSSVSLLSPRADSALRVVFYPCDFNTLTGNISTLTYIRFISTPFCCTGFHNFYWCLDCSLYHVIKVIPYVWGLPFEEVVESSWYYDHDCCYDCIYQMGLVWQKILFGWWSLMSSLRTVMVQLREQV